MTNINNGDNGSSIIQAFPWSSFFKLYFTLGCPVTLQYFQTRIRINLMCQKLRINAVVYFHLHKINEYFSQRILSDHVGIGIIDYFQSMTTFRVMSDKDDFSL